MSSKSSEESISNEVSEIKSDIQVIVRQHQKSAKATADALRGLVELDESRESQIQSLRKTNRVLVVSTIVILITLILKVIS